MKTFFLLSSCFLSLLFSPLALAETNIIYKDDNTRILQKDEPFRVVFDSPMVSEAKVGKTPDEDFLNVSPKLKIEGKWLSRNELEVTPREDIPFRAEYEFKLGNGVQDQKGKTVPRKIGTISGKRELNLKSCYVEPLSLAPSIVVYSFDKEEISPEMMTNGYFTNASHSKKIPVDVHSVTVGESRDLMGWESYSVENYLTEEQLKKKEYVIPYCVKITPREKLSLGEKWNLIIPSLGPLSDNGQGYTDYCAELSYVQNFSAQLIYYPSDQEENAIKEDVRIMKLRFNVKTQPLDKKLFFRDNISLFIDGKKAENVGDSAVKEITHKGKKLTFEIGEIEPNSQNENSLQNIKVLPIIIKGEGVFVCDITCSGIEAYDGQKTPEKGIKVTEDITERTARLDLDAGNNGVLSMGSRSIRLSLDNIKSVQLMAKKISDDYGIKTMTAYSRYYDMNWMGKDETVSEIVKNERFLPFEMLATREETGKKTLDANGKRNLTVTLDELFGKKVEPGLYFIEVQGYVSDKVVDGYNRFGTFDENGKRDKFCGNKARFASQVLLQVTDMGLLWKMDKKRFTGYVYSLSEGKPLDGANIEFLAMDGRVLGQENAEGGVCSSEVPQETKYVRVAKGKDAYITELESNSSLIGLWNYHLHTPSYELRQSSYSLAEYMLRQVFTFSDRRLYRPGETVHLKGMVRGLTGNNISLIHDKAFITIKTPRGEQLLRQELVFSEHGTFDLTFKLPADNVGRYGVHIYFPDAAPNQDQNTSSYSPENDADNENRKFYTSFNVLEFKRNAFEVKTVLKEASHGEKDINVTTEAVNYTGIPVSKAEVWWHLSATEQNFYPKNYREYKFGDYRENDAEYWAAYYGYYDWDSSSSREFESKRNGNLDDKGMGRQVLKLPETDYPRTLSVSVCSVVIDANEQALENTADMIVHPAEVYVGIKANSQVGKVGENFDLGLIAVKSDEKPYDKNLPVSVKVTRREYQPVRYTDSEESTVKNESTATEVCSFETVVTPQDTQLAGGGGKTVSIPVKDAGEYTVDITGKDEKGHPFRSTSCFWVYGGDTSPWEYIDGLKIKLIPDKGIYKAGDTAKILIQTPVEGDAVITVEREKVLRHYQKKVTLKDSIIEVPLGAEDAPNVYVSVFLVKGALQNTRQLKEPQLKLGYCELAVEPVEHTLKVQVNVPEKPVLPGEKIEVSGKVTNFKGEGVPDAEVTLYAEDEGVLDVIGYNLPDPISLFYSSRALGLNTYTMLHQILSEDFGKRSFDNKGTFIGGGLGGRKLRLLEERLRKDFNPCACWLPQLKTAPDGTFKAEITNPDTLTRYRVMAVVADKNASFGAGQSRYVVNKPVMLEPGTPVFASQGDTLIIPVTVSATERRAGTWKISLKGSDGVSVKEPEKVMELPETGNAVVPFEVTFNKTGTEKMTWSIAPVDTMGKALEDEAAARLKDTVEVSFPVVLPVPSLNARKYFTIPAGKSLGVESLLSKEFEGAECDLTVKLSLSPLLYARGPVNFLMEYPYGCLEQKSSKLIPWIYADILDKFMPATGKYSLERRPEVLGEGVLSILGNQNSQGALNYWPESGMGSLGNIRFTQYAAFVLLQARGRGVPLPESSWNNLMKFMKTQNDVFSLLIQAKAGVLRDSDLNKALDEREKMGYTDRLYLAMALLETKRSDAREIAADLINRKGKYRSRENLLYGEENQLPLELMARTRLDAASPKTGECFARFVAERASSPYHSLSTWRGGWNLMALGEYLSKISAPAEQVNIELLSKSGKKESSVLSQQDMIRTFALHKGAEVEVKNLGDKGNVYGELKASGKPRTLSFEGVTDKGFIVSRVYKKRNEKGKWIPSHEFQVGDIVQITLTVKKKDDTTARYVVMEDYMPSAFEPVDPELTTQALSRQSDYAWNSWVSHCEFHKESVRFFADDWSSSEQFEASYLARVTKAGAVTAPPAKAELMYKPEVYGLSPNERFQVKSKP